MLKKSPILIFGLVLAVAALAFVLTSVQGTAADNSKRARAERLWKMSGHAEAESEVFKHWDAEGSIPTSCAK